MSGVVTKALTKQHDWLNVFDEVLFVRLYVHYGEEDPKRAVRQTLATISTASVLQTISDGIINELCLQIMTRPRVQDAINQFLHMQIYRERKMGTQWVLAATKDVYERCMQMLPIKDAQGNPVFAKFNPQGALKAIELAGKHVDVQAFKEVIEHETGPNLTDVLTQARKRLEEGTKTITIEAEEAEVTEIDHLPPDQVAKNLHALDDMLGEVGYGR